MDAAGFCNVMLKESDIRHQHAKVHLFQHQTFAAKKNHNPKAAFTRATFLRAIF